MEKERGKDEKRGKEREVDEKMRKEERNKKGK